MTCRPWILRLQRIRGGLHLLLLLLVLLLARSGSSPLTHEGVEVEDEEDDPCSSESYDALACFLSRVSLALPSQSFREGILKLTIDDLTCSHFAVTGLKSSRSSSKNETGEDVPLLDIRVNRMAAICTAQYQVTAGVGGSLTATVGQPQQWQWQQEQGSPSAAVTGTAGPDAPTDPYTSSFSDSQPALEWSLNIPSSTANAAHLLMPEQVQTGECSTSLGVVALTFSGSISSHVVELFHTPIANYVTSQINQQVCPNLVSQVDPLISNAIHQLETTLNPFLLPPNSTHNNHDEEDTGHRSAPTTTRTDPTAPSTDIRSLEDTDAASSSSATSSPKDDDWIDFDRDAPALNRLLQVANRYARDYLHGGLLRHAFPHTSVVPPLHHCGAGFDGWNGILSTLTGGGHLDVPLLAALEPIQFDLPGIATHVDVWLERAALAGINDWDHFQVLDPVPPHDFATHLAFGGGNSSEDEKGTPPPLQLLLDLRINATSYQPVRLSMRDGTGLVERVQVMVNVSSLDVKTQFQVGVRETDWNALPLQTVIDAIRGIVDPTFNNVPAVQCLLHGVDLLQATSLSAMLRLSGASVLPLPLPSRRRRRRQLDTPAAASGLPDDGLEREVDQLINTVADLVLTTYQPYISAALQGLTQGPLIQVVNDALQHWLDSLRPPPPSPPLLRRSAIFHPAASATAVAAGNNATCSVPTPEFPDWVNFSTVAPLNELNRRLQEPTTLDTINAYSECVVGFLTHALRDQIQSWLRPGNGTSVDAAVTVDVRQLEIVHVGNLRDARVAQPERDGKYLSNGLRYGTSNGSDADSPRPALLVGLDVLYPPLNATISLNVTLSVDDIELGLGTILHYDWNGLQQLALHQLARNGVCAAAPASDWTWIDTVGRLGYFAVTLNGSAQVGLMSHPVVVSIDSKNHPSIDDAAEAVFLWVADSTHDLANAWTDAVRARADRECGWDGGSDGEENDDSDRATLTSILVIMAAILLLAQPSVILIQYAPQRSRDFPEDRQLARPLLRGQNLPSREIFDDDPGFLELEEIETQDDPKKSLMDCQSHLVACAFAVAVVVTMVLLLASHLSVIATVDYSLVFGGRAMPVSSVVEINPHRSANLGLNPLIVVVGLFSGLWPFLRLSLMLYVWVTNGLTSTLRHRVVIFLDALGKFVFSEVYVMCVAMVIFHYHLQVDEQHMLDVYLTPKFGLYGFWLGTVVSVALGHFLVYCHRRPEWARLRAASRRPSSLWNQQRSVLTHSFAVGGDNSSGGGGHRQLSRLCYAALLLWLLGAVLFLGLGVSRHIFSVDLDGVASLPFTESEKHVEYSLLSLGARLPDSAGSRSWSLGIAGLTAFFFATVLILPLVALIVLALLLVWPLTAEQQLELLSWSDVVRAWSAVEVAAVSVVVAISQFPHLVQRAMEESRCDWMMRELLVDGNSDAELPLMCYALHVSWHGAAVTYLVVGVLLQSVWVRLVLELARQAVWERLYPDDDSARRKFRSFVVARLSRHRCLRWMWAPPHDLYFFGGRAGDDGRDESTGSSGPPVQGGGGGTTTASSSMAPWQVNGSFEDEWQEAAERDPEWKEWKDATNVT